MTLLPVIERIPSGWRLTWDCDAEVLEIDLRTDGKTEWWWRDRGKNESAGSEDPEDGFSEAFAVVAKAFARRAAERELPALLDRLERYEAALREIAPSDPRAAAVLALP